MCFCQYLSGRQFPYLAVLRLVFMCADILDGTGSCGWILLTHFPVSIKLYCNTENGFLLNYSQWLKHIGVQLWRWNVYDVYGSEQDRLLHLRKPVLKSTVSSSCSDPNCCIGDIRHHSPLPVHRPESFQKMVDGWWRLENSLRCLDHTGWRAVQNCQERKYW